MMGGLAAKLSLLDNAINRSELSLHFQFYLNNRVFLSRNYWHKHSIVFIVHH